MKNNIFYLFLFFVAFLTGCSTEIDMYDDYKDVTIVYAIADISEDTTWVKITKAFIGPGNALLIASNPDSSNYSYKLEATLVGRKNGNDLEPIPLDTITIYSKHQTEYIINEDGDTIIINPFYSPAQLMYYAVGQLDSDANYTLNITRNDGVTLSASTGLVDNFSVIKPVNRIVFSQTNDGTLEWSSAKNGIRNEVSFTFHYSEFGDNYSDTLTKSVSWFVGVRDASTGDGGEGMDISYSGIRFFKILEAELPDIPNVERWAEKVDITIACGSQVLSTYLDINSGGASLLEEVPVYSNIDGGTGIFASRHTIVKTLKLSSTTERDLIEDYNLGFKFKSK